jgi:hypothetical protein
MTIGRNVLVQIITPKEDVKILAKVDTGAYSSSIDEKLFKELNLDEKILKNKIVRNVMGEEERDVYEIDFIVKGMKITSQLNVFDRSDMKYQMILGRKDIKQLNALVDVKQKDK